VEHWTTSGEEATEAGEIVVGAQGANVDVINTIAWIVVFENKIVSYCVLATSNVQENLLQVQLSRTN